MPSLDYITDGAGRLETRLQQVLLAAEFENGDRLFAGVTDNFEVLKRPFQIAQDVSVPVGGYSFVNTKVVYALGERRQIAGAIAVERGGFFGGAKTSIGYTRPRVSLGAQLTVEPSLSFNYITLPEATFTSKLVSTRATYTVTPRMFVSALLQGLPRSLLKFSGDSVHDYATICAESPRPSLASRARSATTSCGTPV